jgi:hypothetical protein
MLGGVVGACTAGNGAKIADTSAHPMAYANKQAIVASSTLNRFLRKITMSSNGPKVGVDECYVRTEATGQFSESPSV